MILLSAADLRDLLEEHQLWDRFGWTHEVQIESVLREICEIVREYSNVLEDTNRKVNDCIFNVTAAMNEIGDGAADTDRIIRILDGVNGNLWGINREVD